MSEREYVERVTLIKFVKDNTPNIHGDTTMRSVQRTLKAVPAADVAPKSEIASEIFEEIGKILYKHTDIAIKEKSITCELAIDYIGEDIAELKKKYTEGET